MLSKQLYILIESVLISSQMPPAPTFSNRNRTLQNLIITQKPTNMTEETQIIQLNHLPPSQILKNIQQLLDQSDFSRFTLILTRKPTRKRKEKKITESLCRTLRRQKSKFTTFSHHKRESECNFKLPDSPSAHDDPENPNTQALRFYSEGQYDSALHLLKQEEQELEQSLQEGLQTVKEYHDVCFHIGNCHYRLQDYDSAIAYFTRQFPGEQTKQRGQKLNNLGSCYAHIDQPRLSLSSYAQALKIYSQFPQIDCSNLLNNLGMLYAQSSMFQTAEKYFLQSIEQRKSKSPESSGLLYSSYLQLGNCRKHSKKYPEAINSLQLALNFAERGFGDQTETLVQIASIYQKCEKWTEALDCYQKLSDKCEEKGFLYERAAEIHRQMGHQADYDRFIQKAYEQYRSGNNEQKLLELKPRISRLSKR